MTRRERLMATLRGERVDRPAVNFYEIGGFKVDPNDTDPFNIYNSPSWQPLLRLAEEHTDLIRMRGTSAKPSSVNPSGEFFTYENYMEGGSRFSRMTLNVAGRTMTSLSRRDPEVDTSWALEHLLKDVDDLKAYLQLPDEVFSFDYDVSGLVDADREVGDAGIVMVDTADPLCLAASLFSMEDYTIIALTEPELFHQLLEKVSKDVYAMAEFTSREFPGHLWRIYGPEYATEPYLPPRLFEEYVVRYTKPMVEAIQKHGGFARIHCHGRLKSVLPMIVGMGAGGLDPIEPEPQGDVELADVRRDYGKEMVLFGNLESSDIENLDPAEFERVVAKSIEDGTSGEGRGFVLMPSSAPYGREITPKTLANYETIFRWVGA